MAQHPDGVVQGFGRVLQECRGAAGLTQLELAGLTGASVGTIRDLEQGRTLFPRPALAERLAAALGLDSSRAGTLLHSRVGHGGVGLAGVGLAGGGLAGGGLAGGGLAGGGSGTLAARLRISVLGPLAAWREGTRVRLGGARRQAVLGLLAVQPGATLQREAIIDAVWGDDPPTAAAGVVQAHISRLRRALDPAQQPAAPGVLLVCAGGGYRLQAAAGQLDLLAFRQLAARARTACAAGDLGSSCDLFAQAISLWRDDPLAGLDLLRAHPAVTAVARERLAAELSYAHACEQLGQPGRAIVALWAATAREPMHELAHARLMVALASTGDQAAALRIYDSIRRRLDDELGVYPGPELADAYGKVLRQEVPAATSITAARPDQRPPGRITQAAPEPMAPRQLSPAARRRSGCPAEMAADDGAGFARFYEDSLRQMITKGVFAVRRVPSGRGSRTASAFYRVPAMGPGETADRG